MPPLEIGHEIEGLAALGRDAQARADIVEFVRHQAREQSREVYIHEFRLEAHFLGDGARHVDVEAGGLAGLDKSLRWVGEHGADGERALRDQPRRRLHGTSGQRGRCCHNHHAREHDLFHQRLVQGKPVARVI